jgi:ABC-2 type transport system ATP-binding protein
MSVRTVNLGKEYGDTVALDSVDLTVAAGSVYGLVGPNGAGKTTLLAILSGLRRQTAGSIEVSSTNVGVLPDTPRFDTWLTAREVVDLARSLANGAIPGERVEEVLDDAGLAEAAGRKVGGFSRGMLQRLGVATAVVGEPDLLLLDEPAAALDPAGRREVLDLITRLRGRATVIFSSHILDDVQEVCDDIGILRRGELVYQGSLDGLLADRRRVTTYEITVRGGGPVVGEALGRVGWVAAANVDGDHITLETEDREQAEQRLVAILASTGVPVVSVVPREPTLEDVFLEVTQ